MNNTMKIQLEHRTIRKFKDKAVDESLVKAFLEIINRTATSVGMQSFSIIRIKDKDLRKKLAEVTSQDYIIEAPEVFLFLVDQYRNYRIAREKGLDGKNIRDMDKFFQGWTDASLAGQNLMVALESAGLGGVYFGSVLNDPDRVIELFNLEELTFPVFAVGFGHPDQEPQLKPRLNIEKKTFTDSYKSFDSYLDLIEDYDREMTEYYDLRDANRRVDSFSDQIKNKYSVRNEKRSSILKSIRKQGFELDI